MKFFCQKCNTKYAIADEKVRGKVLKIRCKKCQAIIVVREGGASADNAAVAPAAATAPAPAAPARTQPARGSASPASRPAAVRPTAPARAPAPARPAASARAPGADDDVEDSTRVAATGEMNSLLSGMGAASAAQRAPRPQPAKRDLLLWYVAHKGQQSPPLTRDEISERIRSGELGARAYGWNQNLPEWKRLGELPEFADDFAALKRPAQGAQVVDFQKKVAERKRADAGVQRARAIEALDQIADLVRTAPEQPAPQPAKPPFAERPTRRDMPAVAPVAKPAPQPLAQAVARPAPQPAVAAASAPPAVARPARPAVVAPAPTAPAPAPVVSAPVAPAPGSAPQRRDAAMEELFFDPSSIQTFPGGQEGVVKDEAGAVASSAGGVGESFDPFALVPDSAPDDLPRKESTRVFVAAAGLQNRARKHRTYAAVAIATAVLLVLLVGLDAVGVIRIPLLHGYVQSVKLAVSDEAPRPEPAVPEEHVPLTDDEKAAIKKALLEGNSAAADEVRRKARSRAGKRTPDPAKGIDLSDNVRGDRVGDDPTRRGGGEVQAVDLSDEQRLAMKGIAERNDLTRVAINVKPGIGEIKLPRVHKGGLDEKQIGAVVRDNQKSVQECVNREAKYGVELPPALVVAATIEPSGTVSQARLVGQAPGLSALSGCLVQRVRSWKFPSFTGQAMDVEIPFKFTTVH
jgi:predicted Zn finger-like uncharacterized protein